MRRVVVLFILTLAVAVALSGCKPLIDDEPESISIYTTFYPIYALTDAVMHGVPDAALHLMAQPQDGCLRSYQLSDWDLYLLSRGADAVIMGGRGLESFESTLFAWGDDGPAVSAVLYNIELYNRGNSHNDESDSHLDGPNPHLYMSLEGAGQMIESVAAAMQSLDPRYSDLYVQNATDAQERLETLRERLQDEMKALAGQSVILMNEALIYPARDFGLEVADWIDRESGEALYDDALDDCLDRLTKLEARVILIEKQAPQAFVEALEDAGFDVARLDILSTHHENEGFDVYLDVQAANARSIKNAFDRIDAGKDIN